MQKTEKPNACKAKGIFRKDNQKPLVGDDVQISILDHKEKTGNITAILPRKNSLIRPAVANVDQAMVIFAMESPKPNFLLLDRFLIMMEQQDVPSVICFNKGDLAEPEEQQRLCRIYEDCGYQVIPASIKDGIGVDQIRKVLQDKTTVVAGPSGVGKSSLTNRLQDEICMETGEISRKLKRGRHIYPTFPGDPCRKGYLPGGYAWIFFFIPDRYGRRSAEGLFSGIYQICTAMPFSGMPTYP